ncbi:MAG: flavodoxin family protein [Spirochaetales bacterium]|nr:flavodoxin family protein [Spirochaetales bacterium]
MIITMLYDSEEVNSRNLAREATSWAESNGHEIIVFDANEDPIAHCLGCFGCWIKTPGICVHTKDRGGDFLKSAIRGDYILRITKITFGGYSSSLKNYTDRLIPLLHPYFMRLAGEMHHRPRYSRYPELLTIGWGAACPEEEATFKKLYKANLLNFFERGAGQPLILPGNEAAWENKSGGEIESKTGRTAEWLSEKIGTGNIKQEAAV